MPATRSPALSAKTMPYQCSPISTSRYIDSNVPNAQDNSLLLSRTIADDVSTPPPASPPARRRRTPNAFILYRSYIIANMLYPTELNHQSDVSCYVAERWRAMSASARSVFFRMAEDLKRRVQVNSTRSEPYRKKRSRSNKNITVQGNSLHAESSPGSDAGVPLPITSTPFSPFPLRIPGPSFESVTLPPSKAFTSSSPSAPQAFRAIPPHLLNWGREANGTKTDVVEHSEFGPSWSSSHPSIPFQTSYRSDAACFESPDVGMLDFQLLFGMSTDFMTALPDTPPFGVYPPA